MMASPTIPVTGRLIAWSRSALVALPLLNFAGITTNVLTSESTPFG